MAIEIVDLPIENGGSFQSYVSYVSLPKGNNPPGAAWQTVNKCWAHQGKVQIEWLWINPQWCHLLMIRVLDWTEKRRDFKTALFKKSGVDFVLPSCINAYLEMLKAIVPQTLEQSWTI
jgi:hypothetical protein